MNFRRLLPYVGDGLARLLLLLALLAALMASAGASIPTAPAPQSMAIAAPDASPSALLRFVHPQQELAARTGQHIKILPPCAAGLRPDDPALDLSLLGADFSTSAWQRMHNRRVEMARVRGPPRA